MSRGTLIYTCRRCGKERAMVLVPNAYTAANAILLGRQWNTGDLPKIADVMPCDCTPNGMAVGDFVAFEIEPKGGDTDELNSRLSNEQK